jgi:hypothetical protein
MEQWVILTTILGIIVSAAVAWIVARKFGDVAGTEAAIKYQERKEFARRQAVLEVLRSQADALEAINTHNMTATDKVATPIHLLPIPYPVSPFETAVLSEWGISVASETVGAITKYSTKARELNVLIGSLQAAHLSYPSGTRAPEGKKETQTFIFDQATNEMPKLIDALKEQIENEKSR